MHLASKSSTTSAPIISCSRTFFSGDNAPLLNVGTALNDGEDIGRQVSCRNLQMKIPKHSIAPPAAAVPRQQKIRTRNFIECKCLFADDITVESTSQCEESGHIIASP